VVVRLAASGRRCACSRADVCSPRQQYEASPTTTPDAQPAVDVELSPPSSSPPSSERKPRKRRRLSQGPDSPDSDDSDDTGDSSQ
jgi:hypothetical protein